MDVSLNTVLNPATSEKELLSSLREKLSWQSREWQYVTALSTHIPFLGNDAVTEAFTANVKSVSGAIGYAVAVNVVANVVLGAGFAIVRICERRSFTAAREIALGTSVMALVVATVLTGLGVVLLCANGISSLRKSVKAAYSTRDSMERFRQWADRFDTLEQAAHRESITICPDLTVLAISADGNCHQFTAIAGLMAGLRRNKNFCGTLEFLDDFPVEEAEAACPDLVERLRQNLAAHPCSTAFASLSADDRIRWKLKRKEHLLLENTQVTKRSILNAERREVSANQGELSTAHLFLRGRDNVAMLGDRVMPRDLVSLARTCAGLYRRFREDPQLSALYDFSIYASWYPGSSVPYGLPNSGVVRYIGPSSTYETPVVLVARGQSRGKSWFLLAVRECFDRAVRVARAMPWLTGGRVPQVNPGRHPPIQRQLVFVWLDDNGVVQSRETTLDDRFCDKNVAAFFQRTVAEAKAASDADRDSVLVRVTEAAINEAPQVHVGTQPVGGSEFTGALVNFV